MPIEARAIALRSVKRDDKYLVYILHDWPEYIYMAPEMITKKNTMVKITISGLILISVENGSAKYKLCVEQLDNVTYALTLKKVMSSFSEPPE